MKTVLWMLTLMVLAGSVRAQEDCAWLPLESVSKALPQYGPWETMSGGQVGACQFMGRSDTGVVLFSLTQMVHPDERAAVDLITSMRKQQIDGVEAAEEPALGEHGYRFWSKGEDHRVVESLVGQRGRVVVIGMISLQDGLSAESRMRAIELSRRGLELASDARAMAAASRCRYFDAALLKKLFGGASYTEQVYGSNSCMAHEGSRVLMLAIVEDVDEETAAAMTATGDCQRDAVAGLGSVSHHCKQGNARATVSSLHARRHLQFYWVPGREPTPAEREHLIALARVAVTLP